MEKVSAEMTELTQATDKRGLLATGGLIGALLASTCCIAPLVLVMLGVGGAWVGNLTAMAPYQWLFLLFAVGCLGAGFWHVYMKPKAECVEGSYCAKPRSDLLIKIVLWVGTLLVITAVAVNLLAPLLY